MNLYFRMLSYLKPYKWRVIQVLLLSFVTVALSVGSLGAMKSGSKDRYFQADVQDADKLVPEGIEARVPYKGSVEMTLFQLVGGLRSGMGYVGCRNIAELRTKPRFIRISQAGLRESHVHDVIIEKEAPNYRAD